MNLTEQHNYLEEEDKDTVGQSESLDEKQFKELEGLTFSSYEYIVPSKASNNEQKQKFSNGEIDVPEFEYNKLDLEMLQELEKVIMVFKRNIEIKPSERSVDIKDRDEQAVVNQAYHWRINQLLASVRMLEAAAVRDDRKFQRYSEFVFGKPQIEIFKYIVEYTRGMIAQAQEQEGELDSAARSLKNVLPIVPTDSVKNISEPSMETFSMASDQTKIESEKLLDIEVGNELTDEEIAEGFNVALEKIKAEGWVSKVDYETGRVAISVDSKRKIIHIPEGRSVLSDEFYELVIHEIGTHIRRELNGKRSKLKLLGIGLDRNVPGEEGIATMRQQVVGGRIDGFSKHALYLGISLAYGLDGQKRGFREVYEILEKYYYFLETREGGQLEKNKEEAKDLAWKTSVRIFRGTSGEPGVCFTKDLSYLEGNIGIWQVIERNPEEMHRFNVGKYDPNNSRHIAILDRLGISDEDLKEIEKDSTIS